MKLEHFLLFDNFQIIFPNFQDKKIREFAIFLNKICGNDVKIVRKASNKKQKLQLKDKDILYIELKNSLRGIIGLFLCLYQFEELIEIKAVKKLYKFDVPKEIRDIFEEKYSYFEKFIEELRDKKIKLKLNEFDVEIKNQLKNLIGQVKK